MISLNHVNQNARSAPLAYGLPVSDNELMPRCRAPTEDGTLCRRKVSQEGQRCYQHQGRRNVPKNPAQPVAPRRPTAVPPPRRHLTEEERLDRLQQQRYERLQAAAAFCADALGSDWQDAVADRAAGYATARTWKRLFTRRGHRRHCRALALSARALLRGQQQVHGAIGRIAKDAVAALGGGDVVQAFTAELAAGIPLPSDAKVTAMARGLQVTGVLLCVVSGDNLTNCYCFTDLALTETKTAVKNVLAAAMGDWTALTA